MDFQMYFDFKLHFLNWFKSESNYSDLYVYWEFRDETGVES